MSFKQHIVAIGLAGFIKCATATTVHTDDHADFASLPTIATASCWDAQPENVRAAVAECGRRHVPWLILPIRAGTDGRIMAASTYATSTCTAGPSCVPLGDVLDTPNAPHILLQVAPVLLDAVQDDVRDHAAADRVIVEPMLDRPMGDVAPTQVRPGLLYSRRHLSAPRPMMVHILQADLDTPGMHVVVTPGHVGRDTAGNPTEFVATKTTTFVEQEHLDAAVNATYFLPFDGGHLLDKPYIAQPGQPVTVDGVSMSKGHLDSDYRSDDPRSDGSLCIHGAHPVITLKACPSGTTEAVGAGPVLMLDGKERVLGGPRLDYYKDNEPRTAIGIDKTGRHLWLVIVDGRQAGYSEGMPLSELTALLREMGANSAMNLDGGGSSTMVLRRDGAATIVNSPIHTGIPGRERPVGNHLGLRIDPTP
jgi:hypothetical protein